MKNPYANLDAETRLKYMLYEAAVQTPDVHSEWMSGVYFSIRKKHARLLREDFCGTFAVACAWVSSGRKRHALGLDLDPQPLAFGYETHWLPLSASKRKRVEIRKANVMTRTRPGSDIIMAGNFSVNIFKREELLLRYFKAAYDSLAKDGIFILEVAGGPGMIVNQTDQRRIPKPGRKTRKKGSHWFTYFWEQKDFDPSSHDAKYSIHFNLPEGPRFKDAFTYDWRLWTIPELRYWLTRAGFSGVKIYWDVDSEYLPQERGSNDYSWISCVVAVK